MELRPRPDPDVYGRVTDPERYTVVADRARALVAELAARFDVDVSSGDVTEDFPTWSGPERETIRLLPVEGVPLVFLVTASPGVVVRFGRWGQEAFPSCGCDACDEQPSDVVERLERLVATATAGDYQERLTRRWLFTGFRGAWGVEQSQGRVFRRQLRLLGRRGSHEWPPWSLRDSV